MLGAVNIVLAEMSILAVYVFTLALFKHRIAAALSAGFSGKSVHRS
jgi:hypothetical protein